MKAIWFRNDLRTQDNPALYFGLQSSRKVKVPLIAIFCSQTEQWQRHDMAACKQFLIKESLYKLQQQLTQLRIPLLVLDCPFFSETPNKLSQLCQQQGITELFVNREYEWNERQRDAKVQQRLQPEVNIQWFDDQCMLAPMSVMKPNQTPYTVFTPFSKRWKQCYQSQPHAPLPKPKPQPAFHFEVTAWPKSLQSLQPTAANQYWEGGEPAALRALEIFIGNDLHQYHQQRDRPDLDSTSKLSAHLSIGTISANQCLQAALNEQQGDIMRAQTGSAIWINELIWRDFYRHLLIHFPRLSQHRAFKQNTEHLPWRTDKKAFDAWCQGKTGIPIIDAAMRQLLATGWMHNRLRMITAMFLTKHLLIDWRKGEKWFMQHLVDGDLASNNGGWQWSASTGTDAVPYFRIFNPTTQSQKFDPQGSFIRKYLPELAHLKDKEVHDPSKSQRKQTQYPAPIVDLKVGRERALDAFKRLSGDSVHG
jgi:deoxyribodipyrimidine photo-lyase